MVLIMGRPGTTQMPDHRLSDVVLETQSALLGEAPFVSTMLEASTPPGRARIEPVGDMVQMWAQLPTSQPRAGLTALGPHGPSCSSEVKMMETRGQKRRTEQPKDNGTSQKFPLCQ